MPEENPRRRSNLPLIGMGAVLVLVLGAGGYFLWDTMYAEEEALPPVYVQETPQVPEDSTYASSTMGISIKHPKEFTVNGDYFYDQFKGKPIQGVKFTIPTTMATGTNLSADTGISIEQLPRAKACTGDIYILANVRAEKMTEGNLTYSVASSTGAAAGNMYEERVYAIASSSPCTAVRYFIHSTNIGNYPQGAVKEFDRAALLQAFDKIRQSLTFN